VIGHSSSLVEPACSVSTDGGQSWRHAVDGEVLTVAVSPAFADDPMVFARDGPGWRPAVGRMAAWAGAAPTPGLLDLTVLSVALSPRFAEDRTAFVGHRQRPLSARAMPAALA